MTVHIWNVETGELQQLLDIGNFLFRVSFNLDGSRIYTDRGCIELDQSANQFTSVAQAPSWVGYGLSTDRTWMTWNGNKVIWIPWGYRPYRSMVHSNTVAVGTESGRVSLTRFKAGVLPTP